MINENAKEMKDRNTLRRFQVVVASDEEGGIGRECELPWKLSKKDQRTIIPHPSADCREIQLKCVVHLNCALQPSLRTHTTLTLGAADLIYVKMWSSNASARLYDGAIVQHVRRNEKVSLCDHMRQLVLVAVGD